MSDWYIPEKRFSSLQFLATILMAGVFFWPDLLRALVSRIRRDETPFMWPWDGIWLVHRLMTAPIGW